MTLSWRSSTLNERKLTIGRPKPATLQPGQPIHTQQNTVGHGPLTDCRECGGSQQSGTPTSVFKPATAQPSTVPITGATEVPIRRLAIRLSFIVIVAGSAVALVLCGMPSAAAIELILVCGLVGIHLLREAEEI